MFSIAVVQMSSSNRLDENLKKMEQYMARAVEQNAQVVVFPEMAYLMGKEEDWKPHLDRYSELLELFSQWSRHYGLYLIPGSLREPVRGSEGRFFNTLTLHGPSGNLLSKYRKIFLFRANLPDRRYEESEHCEPGNMIVVKEGSPAALGFGLCFDLRFPELFRSLKRGGAQLVLLPSAFTVPTGKDHWKPLLQARAIENQFFVAAPAQVGHLGDGRECYGHSMIVDPWGRVLSELADEEGLLVQTIDMGQIKKAADRVDVWESRRNDLFKL